ncbi:hypothetical protein ACOME3_007734 [Neoechinorhynchus agilis]
MQLSIFASLLMFTNFCYLKPLPPVFNFSLKTDNIDLGDFYGSFSMSLILKKHNGSSTTDELVVNKSPSYFFTDFADDRKRSMNIVIDQYNASIWITFEYDNSNQIINGNNATMNKEIFTSNSSSNSAVEFSLNRSLHCRSKTDIPFDSTDSKQNQLIFRINKINTLMPFNATEEDALMFNKVIFCNADLNRANVVPIVVGVLLLILLMIVLTAYFVTRAMRKRRIGYESLD